VTLKYAKNVFVAGVDPTGEAHDADDDPLVGLGG